MYFANNEDIRKKIALIKKDIYRSNEELRHLESMIGNYK